jgi:hypothetical protein
MSPTKKLKFAKEINDKIREEKEKIILSRSSHFKVIVKVFKEY